MDRISLPDHVAIEHAAGGISDAELFDQFLVMHATAVKVLVCLGMPAELLLIELDGFAQRFLLPRLGRAELLFQVNQSFRKREVQPKLDQTNEVAALAAAVAVEDILNGIDVERGLSFRMQRT